jgi:hypothetical protein
MKVYVLTLGEYEDAFVAGVFPDENTARDHGEGMLATIEEFELGVFYRNGGKFVPKPS